MSLHVMCRPTWPAQLGPIIIGLCSRPTVQQWTCRRQHGSTSYDGQSRNPGIGNLHSRDFGIEKMTPGLNALPVRVHPILMINTNRSDDGQMDNLHELDAYEYHANVPVKSRKLRIFRICIKHKTQSFSELKIARKTASCSRCSTT